MKEYWQSIIEYDPYQGKFYWLINEKGHKKYDLAKGKSFCYKKIKIQSHQLAFLLMEGYIPKMVDHNDHNHFNDKWNNLNASNASHNNKNKTMPNNHKYGVFGMKYNKNSKKWYINICVDGNIIELGSFKNKNVAINNRKYAQKLYGFGKNHGIKDSDIK